MNRHERRLRQLVDARLEPGETFVAWTKAWVSRDGKLHFLLAARNRDFAVLTDRRLMLWSAGFFTRAPRRRVLADRLDELTVESVGRDAGRRMSCRKAGRRPLLLELGKGTRPDHFSIELRDRNAVARQNAFVVPGFGSSAPTTASLSLPDPGPSGPVDAREAPPAAGTDPMLHAMPDVPPGVEPWAS